MAATCDEQLDELIALARAVGRADLLAAQAEAAVDVAPAGTSSRVGRRVKLARAEANNAARALDLARQRVWNALHKHDKETT